MSYTDVIKALSAGPLQDSLNLATVAHDSDCPMCGSPFAVTGYMPDGRLVDGVTLETVEDRCTCDPDITVHYSKPLRVGPKTGRNEPCPCGSGKKFKRCCGGEA